MEKKGGQAIKGSKDVAHLSIDSFSPLERRGDSLVAHQPSYRGIQRGKYSSSSVGNGAPLFIFPLGKKMYSLMKCIPYIEILFFIIKVSFSIFSKKLDEFWGCKIQIIFTKSESRLWFGLAMHILLIATNLFL